METTDVTEHAKLIAEKRKDYQSYVHQSSFGLPGPQGAVGACGCPEGVGPLGCDMSKKVEVNNLAVLTHVGSNRKEYLANDFEIYMFRNGFELEVNNNEAFWVKTLKKDVNMMDAKGLYCHDDVEDQKREWRKIVDMKESERDLLTKKLKFTLITNKPRVYTIGTSNNNTVILGGSTPI
jgi:hypothetical protein